MECPYCHQQHPAESQFCPLTGKKFCPDCGQSADPAWLNCTHCGRSLTARIPKPPTTGFPKLPWLILALGLVGLLCVAAVGFAAFWNWTSRAEVVPTVTSAATGSLTPVAATSQLTPEAGNAGKIAFESARDGNLEIYVMNADGSEQTRLTDNPASDSDPTWSVDGQKIAFSSNRDGNWQIYAMNADGSGQTRLTDNRANDAYPAWSPDGQKIAFTSNRDGNLEIYLMNADGSQQTRITNDPGADSFPDWSADGRHIVFQFLEGKDYSFYQIQTVTAMGSARTSLDSSGNSDLYPSWSPDGMQIAFVSNRDQVWGIDLMNAAGGEPVRLTKKALGLGSFSPEDYVENSFPAWSGDGQKLVFASGRDGNAEIYVMNADGSQPTRLTNQEAYDGMPDWSLNATLSTPAPAGQTPTAGNPVYPNLACALHGISQPSKYSSLFNKPSLYALSCLDQGGWHVYEPDAGAIPPQTPSWLAHLPARPWNDGLVPLHFPDMLTQCPGGRIYQILGGESVLRGKLYMLDGEILIDIQADGSPKIDFITCGTGNELWAGYSGGVSHFDGSVWTHYPASEFLGSGKYVGLVKAIAAAPDGSIWVATSDSIAKFDGTNWQVFEEGKGLEISPYPETMAVDGNGNVWVVNIYGNNSRLLKFDGSKWSLFSVPKGSISSITFDQENRLWAVIDWRTLYTFDPKTNNWSLQFGKEIFSGAITALQFDRQGRLWVITSYGLGVYDGSKWIAYQTHTADLYANSADAILIFGNGPALPALAPKAPGSIHGKLVNADPKVFSKKRVELCLGSMGTDPVRSSYYYGETPCATGAFHVLTTVEADGNFEFTDVPLGTYHIAIEISGNSWISMGDFKVNPGEKTELGEIVYPPESR
jgi:hypothetical protein